MDHDTIELVCIGVGALALLIQAIVLLAIYLGLNKATRSLKEEIEDLRSSIMPAVDSTRELASSTRQLVARLTPKVEAAVTDVAELAHGLRQQAADVETATGEILERVRKQTSRIDTMFSGTLDAVDKAGAFVAETVGKPLRQLSGVLAAIKAIVESLRAFDSPSRAPRVHDDKDMFV
ncbi:MAG TPA: hypothetical protein VN776_10565 [Terracidiphilus sp.]|nr:hypothetical protein [Terracidiphilus sp.]